MNSAARVSNDEKDAAEKKQENWLVHENGENEEKRMKRRTTCPGTTLLLVAVCFTRAMHEGPRSNSNFLQEWPARDFILRSLKHLKILHSQIRKIVKIVE